MIRSEKRLSDLALLLNKDDESLATGAIELLREEEPFEGVVGLLADCYDRNRSHAVSRAIENFMNDIKNPSLQAEILAEIKKERKSSTRRMLVSSCWQSGMDYSAYSIDFADIFLHADYSVALECLTVLEESSGSISRRRKEEIITMIDNHPLPSSDDKQMLVAELKSVMER